MDRATFKNALSSPGFENWKSEFSRLPLRIQSDGTLGEWELDFQTQDEESASTRFRPQTRPRHLPGPGRVAAVMVLLVPISDQAIETNWLERDVDCFFNPVDVAQDDVAVVLTQRPTTMSDHAGQISLPGGKQEPGESIEETALRELQEEIGVRSESVELLGALKPVYIPPSDFTMYPFVGWWQNQSTVAETLPQFLRSELEVQKILIASLRKLLDPKTLQAGIVKSGNDRDGQPPMLHVPYYALGDLKVWGATAIVISELLARMESQL